MSFNGIDWYYAVVVTEEEREALVSEHAFLSESDNMKVYTVGDTYSSPLDHKINVKYVYVLDLDGTDDYYIYFEAQEAPEYVGQDFTAGIQYFYGEVETVPVLP
ncbi:MAG: hypothetical protein Q4B03_06900 [Lachnospiraceae bacterium]|nr:hypothetical protein [Lachnospiraceae bacterium]